MKLRQRWRGKEKHFLDSTILRSSPFGMTNMREDFGGILFPPGSRIEGKKFVLIDLTKASFSGTWMEDCHFERTIFVDAAFPNWTDHGNTFTDCIFEKVDFGGAILGYDGSRYTNCRFEKCNFAKSGFIRAEFTNCVFVECKLRGADFNASSFESCNFIGRLDDVWFRGGYMNSDGRNQFGIPRQNRMIEVSFEKAELHRAVFSQGCPLGKVILPSSGNYILVSDWQRRLLALQHHATLLPDSVGKEVGIFAKVHLVHAEGQIQYLLNSDDIVEDFGKEAAEIISKALA